MRIVICDRHIAFAESLAHVLTSRGGSVVAVVQALSEVTTALSRQNADICVVGIGSDASLTVEPYLALPELTAQVPVVILAEMITPTLRAEARMVGARGLGEMRQGMSELLRLLERVRRGESVLDTIGRPDRRRAGADDAHRMAAFLSTRERAVLSALVRGDDTTTMARGLGISRTTARGHVQGVLTKLGTHSRVGAVTIAVRAELVNPTTGEWHDS